MHQLCLFLTLLIFDFICIRTVPRTVFIRYYLNYPEISHTIVLNLVIL